VPAMPDRGREPLEKVATAPNLMEAEMWKGILQENGIRSMTKNTHFLQVIQAIPDLGPVEIFVLASESEKAKEILAPFIEELEE
jgi:hypothetical protein